MKKLSQQIGVAAIAFVGSHFLSCEKVDEGAPTPVSSKEWDNGLQNSALKDTDFRHVGEVLTDSKLAPGGVAKPNYEKMFATLAEINFMLGEIKCMVRHRARQTGVDLDDPDSNKQN